jgi:hypothetical protein
MWHAAELPYSFHPPAPPAPVLTPRFAPDARLRARPSAASAAAAAAAGLPPPMPSTAHGVPLGCYGARGTTHALPAAAALALLDAREGHARARQAEVVARAAAAAAAAASGASGEGEVAAAAAAGAAATMAGGGDGAWGVGWSGDGSSAAGTGAAAGGAGAGTGTVLGLGRSSAAYLASRLARTHRGFELWAEAAAARADSDAADDAAFRDAETASNATDVDAAAAAAAAAASDAAVDAGYAVWARAAGVAAEARVRSGVGAAPARGAAWLQSLAAARGRERAGVEDVVRGVSAAADAPLPLTARLNLEKKLRALDAYLADAHAYDVEGRRVPLSPRALSVLSPQSRRM